MKFIDLFAGLGGFHIGLSRLGHKCVYACEIDKRLNELYKINFPETPIVDFDIAKVDPNNSYYLPYLNPNLESGRNHGSYYYYWSSEEYDNDSQKTVNWFDRGSVYSTDLTVYGTRNKTDLARIICVRDSN